MSLKDIMAIGGKPGLYKFIAQTKNGIIVESLIDKKRIPAYASDKVSALEDIAIFTEADEVPLKEVFKRIHEKEEGGKAPAPKSSAQELKDYFGELLPEYDRDRVYVSDIKKVFAWYNQLHELEMLDFTEEEKEAGEEAQEESGGEENSRKNQEEEKSGGEE
ncbi:MAG: DUF5606 domain-containing protein [Bacteroidota bacterium]